MDYKEKYLITGALPYANGSIHLGHLVEYTQADIFVRFLKMTGKDAIYLCADDTHGTPVYIKSKTLKITPEELIAKYSEEHQRDFKDFQIEFDFYYSTHSPENEKHTVYIYEQLRKNNHIISKDVNQLFCENHNMFLSDRFVKGTCPSCKHIDQYGDVCENCGLHYNATELIDPSCSLCGSKPVMKTSAHYFFILSNFTEQLIDWTADKEHLQIETRNSINGWLTNGLKNWDISRDAPYFGFKIPGETNKYFYVWLDAPAGYIATTEKYCIETGKDFNSYWHDKSTKIYHFIGKDIVYFHTLFWPAMLMASGYNLPDSVFVHGFLTVNGKKMSKTKGTFITARKYLDLFDPQFLRYYYASKMTANSDDLDLNLLDFQAKVNSDLINKIVNIGSRAVSMINKNFNGIAGKMSAEETSRFDEFGLKVNIIESYYSRREFAKAISHILGIADDTNKYFTDMAPWKLLPMQPEIAHQVCTFSANAFKLISVVLKPVLPKMCKDVEKILNIETQQWCDAKTPLPINHQINLFEQILFRVDIDSINKMIEANLE